MKKVYLSLLLGIVLTSCSTYQYTARQTDVRQAPIEMTDQMVGLTVDYTRQVSATSDYQLTRKDAIAEAEFRCISEQKIDVVVDPIFKVEYNPFKMKTRYKATITGFAGSYKEELNRLDDSKKYTLEEIEKYKLLYDPAFPANYYRKSADGDNYFFNSGALSPKGSVAPASGVFKSNAQPASVMLKHQQAPRAYKPMDSFELDKARRLRNAGIGTFVAGAVVCLGVGVPVLVCTHSYEVGVVGGLTLISVGAAAGASGLVMLSVGAARYNKGRKTQSLDFTLNAGSNGVGLGMAF